MKDVLFKTPTGRTIRANMPDYVDDVVDISEEEYDKAETAITEDRPVSISMSVEGEGKVIRALYSEDLEKQIWIHPRCHVHSGLDVEYENGIIKLFCHECKKPVVNFYVAKKGVEDVDRRVCLLRAGPTSNS